MVPASGCRTSSPGWRCRGGWTGSTTSGPYSASHEVRRVGHEGVNKCREFRRVPFRSEMVTTLYSESALRASLPRLSALLTAPEETRHVARILDECGVRFVVVEPIPGSRIDGACFWLPNKQPVVALSLRLDRIDNFWFVLRHELEHVLRGHGQDRDFILDQDLEGTAPGQADDEEVVANAAASDYCVNQDELNGFIARIAPFFKEERVVRVAQRINVHPGLVVGQLQRRLERYDPFRKYQVKVRQFVTSSALTDGGGVDRKHERAAWRERG